MRKTNKTKAILLSLLCLPFCGGWTVAAEEQPVRYVGATLVSTYASEVVSYVSKEVVEDISTPNNAPLYVNNIGLENSCGAVAGSVIISYYDKYYENLVPDWESYYSTGRYRIQDTVHVPALMKDLYTRMKTNVVAEGVSESEFKSGLTSYVEDKGYSLNYISLGSGNGFSYDAFKSAVNNKEVSVLFVQPSNIYEFGEETNQDRIATTNLTGYHIMVAYGYYEVKYTLSNGTRTDKYLRVVDGLTTSTVKYYKVESNVVSAYQIKIN